MKERKKKGVSNSLRIRCGGQAALDLREKCSFEQIQFYILGKNKMFSAVKILMAHWTTAA